MKRYDWALLALLTVAGTAWPQDAPPVVDIDAPPSGAVADKFVAESDPNDGCGTGCCNLAHPWRQSRTGSSGCSSCDVGICGPQGKVWFDLDYLFWNVNGDRLPPLVTTGPGAAPPITQAGVLPGATILLGDQIYNETPRSGLRVNLGTWLNTTRTLGIQASGFFVLDQTTNTSFDSPGSPILARPFNSTSAPTGPASQIVAYPDTVSGNINVGERNTFQGFDIAIRGNGCCGDDWRLDALIGYRSLRFTEQLQIQQRLVGLQNSPSIGIPVGTIVDSYDRFDTSNQFRGLEVGIAADVRVWQRCEISSAFKASFGQMQKGVGIDGATRFTPQDAANRVGGLLALSSNIGAYRETEATIVPEFNITFAAYVADNVRVRIGYDFIMIPNVQRAGSAIDLNVDRERIPPQLNPQTDSPTFRFSSENLIVQGIHAGVEVRY